MVGQNKITVSDKGLVLSFMFIILLLNLLITLLRSQICGLLKLLHHTSNYKNKNVDFLNIKVKS